MTEPTLEQIAEQLASKFQANQPIHFGETKHQIISALLSVKADTLKEAADLMEGAGPSDDMFVRVEIVDWLRARAHEPQPQRQEGTIPHICAFNCDCQWRKAQR